MPIPDMTDVLTQVRQWLETADADLDGASRCPTCNAANGEGCRTPRTGAPVQRPHANRAGARIAALAAQRDTALRYLATLLGPTGSED